MYNQPMLPGVWSWEQPAGPEETSGELLYVALEADSSYKIGTCEHCVLREQGRPERAWDAQGDAELDFDRERYFALLADLGVCLSERQAYVCP
jgi:hypothetical protein